MFEQHKKLISEHKDPEKMPSVDKSFGIIRAMDLLPSHLRDRLGVRKVPLSYVIRSDEAPAVIGILAPNKATSDDYESIAEELIQCVPLAGDQYNEDNAKVFQIIQDMVNGTSFESSIKAHQRRRNGRAAYLALCQHNLGTSKWDKVVEEAESYMMKRKWTGKNYRFSLRQHISKHREAFNEMVRASQFIPYEVPNKHTRVGRLIKSIQSKDPSIISAPTHIQGSITQRDNFELAADFLLLPAPKHKELAEGMHRVSSIKSSYPPKQGMGKTDIELRYYSKEEYKHLTKAQKKELMNGKKKANKNDPNSHKVAALEQQ